MSVAFMNVKAKCCLEKVLMFLIFAYDRKLKHDRTQLKVLKLCKRKEFWCADLYIYIKCYKTFRNFKKFCIICI